MDCHASYSYLKYIKVNDYDPTDQIGAKESDQSVPLPIILDEVKVQMKE